MTEDVCKSCVYIAGCRGIQESSERKWKVAGKCKTYKIHVGSVNYCFVEEFIITLH